MINKLFLIIITATTFTACKQKIGQKQNTIQKQQLIISGSDTEYPIVKKLAERYCLDDTLVNIKVNSGGTSVGINDILNDKVNIANASRLITNQEQAIATAKKLQLIPIMFAVDAVVIVTNSKLGIDSLTIEQVGQILSGKINNWKQVGGPNKSITIYGRDSSSGTHTFLKGKFNILNYANTVKTFKESAEIVTAIENDIAGIGYCGLGYILDKNGKPNGKVWSMPLSIDAFHHAVSPLQVTAVIRGEYPLTRPLYQYIKQTPETKIKKFIMFELSGAGYKIIKEFGYFPINDYQKEINKLNGLNL